MVLNQEIKIEPLTRVEGHGKVIIKIKGNQLEDVKLCIFESPRFFEKMMQGLPAEEAPRFSERICGICYAAHHLASVKAVENAWKVTPPEPAILQRKLLHYAGFVTSHSLHLLFLCLPDLIDVQERSIIGLNKINPELVKLALKIHEYGNLITEVIGGKTIHTVTAIPGGMSQPLFKEKKDSLKTKFNDVFKAAESFANQVMNLFEKKLSLFNALNKTYYYMGLVKNGVHELYDGSLKVSDSIGNEFYSFKAEEYLDYIAEKVSKYSYVKLPYLKKLGFPKGLYRVGPLARLNVAESIEKEKTQSYFETFKNLFGKPSSNLMAYNAARLVELINALEKINEILNDENLTSDKVRTQVYERKGIGVGIVEAPRGILIHHYETNDDGIIVNANVITPTTQNAPVIETDLKSMAEAQLVELTSSNKEQALWRLETLVRSYDPCISCATHFIEVKHEK
ncbi:Ni/Fe hydrogenase subunit alpha [Candidatus Bathyarchaeota archaeon]|nr:Ni/Fe hydrogenase subunit alpha [Candidatus Bathyarchaeota archaeon]